MKEVLETLVKYFLASLYSFMLFSLLIPVIRKESEEKLKRKLKEAFIFGTLYILTILSYLLGKYLIVISDRFTETIAEADKPLLLLAKNIPAPTNLMFFFYTTIWAAIHFLPPFMIAFGLKNRLRFFKAFTIEYLITLFVSALFPSRSPVFVFPELFTEIPQKAKELHSLSQTDTMILITKGITKFPLLADLSFPSLHVATSFLFFLSAPRKLKPLFFFLYLTITLASIKLGFHYVIDTITGTIISLIAWKLADFLPPLF